MGLMIAPVVILGELVGLRYGPTGVASGLSVATALLILPVIFWATYQMPVTAGDTLKEILRPSRPAWWQSALFWPAQALFIRYARLSCASLWKVGFFSGDLLAGNEGVRSEVSDLKVQSPRNSVWFEI